MRQGFVFPYTEHALATTWRPVPRGRCREPGTCIQVERIQSLPYSIALRDKHEDEAYVAICDQAERK